ncbi:Apoptotic ATPase [Handroanthus impetiginosus]|uniref:Apoptotic ATPase n=1 Tax=Handroanthus impetiginosus TaxID=429701 RepID=A0A2G9GGT5_9LAMI|nr:Apoptotic ATPase [Handroanthus impetiginosus]
MAYFAAVITLKNTIQRLLNSSQISILSPSQKILEFAFEEVRTVQEVLQNNEELLIKNCDNEGVTSLTGQIREAAYKLEDALESHASDQYESLANEVCLHFEEVKEEINYFAETMKTIEKMMTEELSKPLTEEKEKDVGPLKIDGGKKSKMVGLSEEFDALKREINYCTSEPGPSLIEIHGMAGIGKTALAMKIFEDPSVSSHFNPRVFVTIGPKYQSKKVKVMLSILNQMNHDVDKIRMTEDVDLAEHILSSLKANKYLIVFDDVWNRLDLLDLFSLLPKESNPSVVFVTSRLKEVEEWHRCENSNDIKFHSGSFRPLRFLNKEESWDLLCEKVFGEGNLCPFQLEKFGKKIAEHCEGLPLTIVTVANILSNREKTLEYWKKVAEKQTSVFTDAYDQMFDVLILSYNYLSQYLKLCFLYMGAFPQSCRIPYSKLVKLWHVEQFPDVNSLIDFEHLVRGCLRDLFSSNVVLVKQWSSRNRGDLDTPRCWIKTCSLHSAYWHVCVKQASKEKFLHVANHVSSFTNSIKNQRRLCIHNNVLFGIKEVHKSMETISMARSLLCTGPHHQYPVPICFRLRLLRVLDALTIRFYKFPTEVLKLVQLRYLALTYSGKVPGSISKLWNLMYLIVHRHLSIKKSSRDSSYLPMEIWNMKELRHIQVMGDNLLDLYGAVLPNLLTLSDISEIELTPDGVELLYCFDHISHLSYLESLKCVVVNPKPSSQVVSPIMTLPSSLIKLSLSGLGFPWEYMRTITKLPRLEVLKLRCYAFQGPVWEISDDVFLSLQYLLLEDIDLVHWKGNCRICFPKLQRVLIRHCYKLKEILSSWTGCAVTEIVDCPSLALSTEQLRKKYPHCPLFILHDEK